MVVRPCIRYMFIALLASIAGAALAEAPPQSFATCTACHSEAAGA